MLKNQLKYKVITLIMLVLLLVVSSTFLIKTTSAAESNEEIEVVEESSNIYDNIYKYNLAQEKIYLNLKDISPLTNIVIKELFIEYKLYTPHDGITINNVYYSNQTVGIMLLKYQCILECHYIYNQQSYTHNIYYSWTMNNDGDFHNTQTLIKSDNFNTIYTKLLYEDITKGVINLNEINLTQYMPEIYLNIYDITLTNELNPNISKHGIATYFSMDLWNENGTRQQIKLANNTNYPLADSRFFDIEHITTSPQINLDITFKDINYKTIDLLVKNSAIKQFLYENNTLDVGNYESLMETIFNGVSSILSVQVFPGITIALIIGIPLLLGLLLIILKFIRG